MLVEVKVLDSFSITAATGEPLTPRGSKAKALLAFVALQPGLSASRQKLIGLLWSDRGQEQAQASLRTCLTEVRNSIRSLAESMLVTKDSSVSLQASLVAVDAAEMFRGLSQPTPLAVSPPPSWSGELLANLDGLDPEFDEWLLFERASLRARYCDLLSSHMAELLEGGHWDLAATVADAMLKVDPASEISHRVRIEFHARRGDVGAALRQYAAARDILARTIGAPPSPETEALVKRLKSGTYRLPDARAQSIDRVLAASLREVPAGPLQIAEADVVRRHGFNSPRDGVAALGTMASRLPAALSPLVGRAAERRALRSILTEGDSRLVTLAGAGGSGKTRLSIAVAGDLEGHFADGVFFIPLSGVRVANLVLPTVAQYLGVPEIAGQPIIDTLKRIIGEKSVLLVLDNFEQIIPAAPMVVELLNAGPNIRIMITSREALNLPPEREFVVLPLAVPHPDAVLDIAALQQIDSVDLFVRRVRDIRPSFSLTEENAGAVVEICRRLDGLPLAIELAACALRVLDPVDLLPRLRRALEVSGRVSWIQSERHRTMRKAIGWSYDLLDAEEKSVFSRLAVFPGGFTASTAESVCADQHEAESFLSHVISLARKNLVQHDHASPTTRLRMLQPVHEYAVEELAKSVRLSELRYRHLMYTLEFLEKTAPAIVGYKQKRHAAQISVERDNIRSAIEFAIEHDNASALARLLRSLLWFWITRCLFTEGEEWTSRALASTASLGSCKDRAIILDVAGWLRLMAGDWVGALPFFQKCRPMFENEGMYSEASIAAVVEGAVLAVSTDVEMGLTLIRSALQRCREVGDSYGASLSLTALGEYARMTDQTTAAEEHFSEALQLMRVVGNTFWIAALLENLAHVLLRQRNWEAAVKLLEEALDLARTYEHPMMVADYVAAMGHVAVLRGRLPEAARLFGAVDAFLVRLGASFAPADQTAFQESKAEAKRLLGAAAFESWASEGGAWDIAEAVAQSFSLRH
jgi:predicted ATPase/DNA-binding SARP family transcriptional activator